MKSVDRCVKVLGINFTVTKMQNCLPGRSHNVYFCPQQTTKEMLARSCATVVTHPLHGKAHCNHLNIRLCALDVMHPAISWGVFK